MTQLSTAKRVCFPVRMYTVMRTVDQDFAFCIRIPHTTIGQTQVDLVDFHSWVETNSWISMSHMSFDMTSFLSDLRVQSNDIVDLHLKQFYGVLLGSVEMLHLYCFSLISLRKFHVNTCNCNWQSAPRPTWSIHDIMPKLCLNPNYKQVLGEFSGQVSTGSTPGHWAHVGSYRVAKYYECYFAHWLNDMVS